MIEENQILFEKYLSGSLSQEELLKFESRLDSDSVFSEDFNLYRLLDQHQSEKLQYEKGLESINTVHKSYTAKIESPKINKKANSKKIWILLGGLAFLIAGGYIIMKNMKADQEYNRMMADYQFPISQGTRSLQSSTTRLDSAILFFDLRELDKSKNLFLDIVESNPQDSVANFYLAHIYFLGKDLERSQYHRNYIKMQSWEDFINME